MNTLREKVLHALNLSADVSDLALMRTLADRLGAKVSIRELGAEADGVDPREQLRELSEKRAREKGIGFTEAMKQIQAEDPALTEAVADYYAGLSR
jgi:hypothetical protein